MPNLAQAFETVTLTNTTESAANTETVVATLSGVTTRFPGQTLSLRAWAKVSFPATTTAALLAIRKASLTGTRLTESTPDASGVAASKVGEMATSAEDTPGEGQFTYVVTYVGTGEGAAATFLAVRLTATLS